MKRYGLRVAGALAAIMIGITGPAHGAQRESLLRELRSLVDLENERFLLTEIQRVRPYYAIRNLARFQRTQDRVGGGFCDCLPDQVMSANEIPLPVDDSGVVETAIYLAALRQINLTTLEEMGYPSAFPSSFLVGAVAPGRFPSLTVVIDTSVPLAFLEAMDDEEVSMAEARAIAQMPANREMLRYISERCDGAEPVVGEQTLAYLIWKAGSRDPLDRLWRWLNPTNDFGYAGLAADAARYRESIDDIRDHHRDLTEAAAARVGPFLPYGSSLSVHFVLAPGCPNVEWATRAMSGTSVLRIKTGGEGLVRGISAAAYRQYLTERFEGRDGVARTWNANSIRSGSRDEALAVLDAVIATTVLEGSIDYVSDPYGSIEGTWGFSAGVGLIEDLIDRIVSGSPLDDGRGLFDWDGDARKQLVVLGRRMAELVAESDGPEAVTALLERGSVAFFLRAAEIGSNSGVLFFDQEDLFLIGDLPARLDR
jgi:hypothetical protein